MRSTLLAHAVFYAACTVSYAATADAPVTVQLAYGVNEIDLGPGTSAAMAVLAHRENFNAHGFDVLTMYVKPPLVGPAPQDWQIVTVFDKDKESLSLAAAGGADCMLHDFRLVREPGQDKPILIVAERDIGNSYADSASVNFKYYKLRKNSEGDIGHPLYYFALTGAQTSRKRYCDVEQAFIEELGITDYREPRAMSVR
jgi:hypothetical protein